MSPHYTLLVTRGEKKTRSALVLISITIALTFVACGGGHSETRYGLGEMAGVDGWPDLIAVEFTRDVDREELFDPDTVFDVQPTDPDEEVVVVSIRLINDEGEPFIVDPFWMFSLRSQGKEITATYELFADLVMEEETLPPDGEAEGILAFTVARGLRDFELVYQPGAEEALEGVFERLSAGDFSEIDVETAVISLE